MHRNTRRRFLTVCATTIAASGVLAGSGSAASTTDAGGEVPPQPPEAVAGWSAARGGYGNTAAVGSDHGFGDGFDFDTLEVDWTADAGGLPVVDDGIVYLPVEGAVHALDAADGSLEWQSEDVGASEPPTVAYGTIFVSGERGVTALDAANGDVRWQTSVSDAATDSDADEPAVSPPTVAFERVYVSADSGLSAIDCETGEIDWRCDSVTVTIGDPWEEQNEVDRTIEGGVAATDECVFVLAEAGTIVGLDPLTGEQGLTLDTYYYYLNDLVATDGRVFVRTESEEVVAYDSTTGEREERWSGGIRRLAVRGETLVFVTGYELVAVDLESGDERWSVGKYSHSIGDPVIACNAVLVNFGLQGGKYENSLVAFDLDDGSEQWVFSRTESAFVGGRCAVADRTIYIDDGGLTTIRANESERDEGDEEAEGDTGDDERGEADETDGPDSNTADEVQAGSDETEDGGETDVQNESDDPETDGEQRTRYMLRAMWSWIS